MIDGLPIVHMTTAPFHAAMADMRRASDRAAMWAVRESARKTAAAAKKHAPVQTGRYKKSIRSSKQLARVGSDGYRVRVGPRGDPVYRYSQKVEAKSSPMRSGFNDVRAQIGGIHEKALAKALAKYL